MLSALLNSNEPGRICEIVQPGNEFEVHTDFSWVSVPDDTTPNDRYNPDGTISKYDPLSIPGFAEHAYMVARGIAYQSIGNQLDMLYREIKANGTISTDGEWFNHIVSVKQAIPKDDPVKVLEWNVQHWESVSGNTAPV
jgi:hypothetical protein